MMTPGWPLALPGEVDPDDPDLIFLFTGAYPMIVRSFLQGPGRSEFQDVLLLINLWI